ncbi:hypothetical protein [Nocardia sp. NPDC003979]
MPTPPAFGRGAPSALDADPVRDIAVLTAPDRHLRHVIHGETVTDIATAVPSVY